MHVGIRVRPRPFRLGFLCPLDNQDLVRQAIEINTCIAGGMYNAIVPDSDDFRSHDALFDFDYLVALPGSSPGSTGFPEARTIHFPLPQRDPHNPPLHPIPCIDSCSVYRALFEAEFHFERRSKEPFVILDNEAASSWALFLSAVFGAFPAEQRFQHHDRIYRHVFQPAVTVVDGSNLVPLLAAHSYPLWLGSVGLTRIHYYFQDKQLHAPVTVICFLLDTASTRDIVCFWNMRAAGFEVWPIPIDQARDVVPILDAHLSDYSKAGQLWVVAESDSTRAHRTSATRIMENLRKRASRHRRAFNPYVLATWSSTGLARSAVHYSDEVQQLPVRTRAGWHHRQVEAISLRSKVPAIEDHELVDDFADSWGTVVSFEPTHGTDDVPAVLPSGPLDCSRLLDVLGKHLWVSDEGIVAISRGSDRGRDYDWRVPTGADVLGEIIQQAPLAESPSGSLSRRLIQVLGGLYGGYAIAHKEMLDLFEAMSRQSVYIESPKATDRQSRVTARGKTAPRQRVLGVLTAAGSASESAEEHLSYWLERQVMRVGLKIKCPVCQQHTWYELDRLSYALRCERCLTDFPFPQSSPKEARWEYRTVGPFAVEDYALGSYSVVLTLLFLSSFLRDRLTWAPSFFVDLGDSRTNRPVRSEIDFACLAEDGLSPSGRTMIAGECKSFGAKDFDEHDVEAMRMFGHKHPEAILAFCTLNNELSAYARRQLRALATERRRQTESPGRRSSILVLTGKECLGGYPPPLCWTKAGSDYEAASKHWGPSNLRDLCEMSYWLYVDRRSWRATRNHAKR